MAAGNVSKRLRIGSDETETECQKCSHIIHESISCSGCKLSYCLKCAKISELFTIVLKVEKWINLCGLVLAVRQHFLH